MIAAGAVGINFEDQIINGEGLYSVEEQSARIKAIRQAAEIPLFINARTDARSIQKLCEVSPFRSIS